MLEKDECDWICEDDYWCHSCGKDLERCSVHQRKCRECRRGICSAHGLYCTEHGIPCRCVSEKFVQCAGKCRRWFCFSCSAPPLRFNLKGIHCRDCAQQYCPVDECPGVLIRVQCTFSDKCRALVCTSRWKRCHYHSEKCYVCKKEYGNPNRRFVWRHGDFTRVIACNACWDSVLYAVWIWTRLKVPGDVIEMILKKLTSPAPPAM